MAFFFFFNNPLDKNQTPYHVALCDLGLAVCTASSFTCLSLVPATVISLRSFAHDIHSSCNVLSCLIHPSDLSLNNIFSEEAFLDGSKKVGL